MKDPENPLQDFTIFDWLAVGAVGLAVLFCLQWPFLAAPQFAKMFADFGGELPDLTQLALTTWFPLMLGLNPASVVFHALSQKHTLARRRLLIGAALVLSLGFNALLLVAMYLPIFSIAGKIE